MENKSTGCRTAVLRGSVSGEELRERYVDVPRFLGYCGGCRHFGQFWSCPPYDFDPMTLWAAYDRLDLLAMQIVPETPEARARAADSAEAFLAPFRAALDEELAWQESRTPGSLRLNAGRCRLCRACARPAGQPCRRRGEMRYSIESLGGDVGGLAADILHTPLRWGRDGQPPEYYVLVGGLLRSSN